jgi:hypothetical protein
MHGRLEISDNSFKNLGGRYGGEEQADTLVLLNARHVAITMEGTHVTKTCKECTLKG